MKRKNLYTILAAVTALILLSLACNQAGEIITPAEATQNYVATKEASESGVVGDAEDADYPADSEAILTGVGYLVGLYSNPGDVSAVTFATRGDKVTVEGSQYLDDVIWYRVESSAGSGWVPAENLKPVE
jgi:hypothetical protein